MKFKMAVDQHSTQLLKISYLYVQDLQRAQQLVYEAYRKLSAKGKEDLPFNQMKQCLIKQVVEGCHSHFKSWSYRIAKGTKNKEYILPQEVEQPEYFTKLLNLPLKEREIVTLHYVAQQSTAEIAELLHIPIASVRTRLHKAKKSLQGVFDGEDLTKPIQSALGDWSELGKNLKELLIDDLPNATSKQKRRFIKPLITIGAFTIAIGIGSWAFSPQRQAENKPEHVQIIQASENELSEQVGAIAGTETTPNIEELYDFRMYEELTLKITEYNELYLNEYFYTPNEAKRSAKKRVIDTFALFHYMENHGYRWEVENRALLARIKKDQITYDMKNPYLRKYYEKMFAELEISVDDYVNYYMMIEREYEAMQSIMDDKQVGFGEDEYYDRDAAIAEYRALLGMSASDYEALYEPFNEGDLHTVDNTGINLPYPEEAVMLQVAENEQGQLIFTSPKEFRHALGGRYYDLLLEAIFLDFSKVFSRATLDYFRETIMTNEEISAKYKTEIPYMLELFKILENSVEWEFS